MRRVLAALLDAALVAILGYLGFRVALWATPCGGNLGNCVPLTPVILLCVLLALVLYFGPPYLAWKSTFGRRLLGVESSPGVENDPL